MNPTQPKSDIMLAWAQILLAFFFTTGIFGLVFFLLIDKAPTQPAILTIAGSVIASLITVLTLQMNYFFARQRPATMPDPDPGAPNANPPIQSAPPAAPLPSSPAAAAGPSPIPSDTRV